MGLVTPFFSSHSLAFQSTHPVWDGTARRYFGDSTDWISIHPSRVGWDYILDPDMDMIEHFNPPIPCGMGRR